MAAYINVTGKLKLYNIPWLFHWQVSVMKTIAEAGDNSKTMEHLIEIGHEIMNKNNLK